MKKDGQPARLCLLKHGIADMKKRKVKKFEEGGSIRERAMRYAALADNPEEQAAFQRGIHEAQQREAEMADLIRAAERRNAVKRADMGSQNDFQPSVSRAANVSRAADSTDYGSEGESYGRGMRSSGISDIPRVRADEPVDIIGQVPMPERPTMMAEPPAYPRRGEMTVRESRPERSVRPEMSDASVPTMDRQPMTEKSVSDRFRETLLSGGATDIRNILGAGAGLAGAAGRAAGRAAGAPSARASAAAERAATKEFTRPQARIISEDPAVQEAKRFMERATQRAAQNRASQRFAEARGRVRARQAERKQDMLDEMRMGGEGGGFKKGGKVSASSRADGIAKRGKTRGRIY